MRTRTRCTGDIKKRRIYYSGLRWLCSDEGEGGTTRKDEKKLPPFGFFFHPYSCSPAHVSYQMNPLCIYRVHVCPAVQPRFPPGIMTSLSNPRTGGGIRYTCMYICGRITLQQQPRARPDNHRSSWLLTLEFKIGFLRAQDPENAGAGKRENRQCVRCAMRCERETETERERESDRQVEKAREGEKRKNKTKNKPFL